MYQNQQYLKLNCLFGYVFSQIFLNPFSELVFIFLNHYDEKIFKINKFQQKKRNFLN